MEASRWTRRETTEPEGESLLSSARHLRRPRRRPAADVRRRRPPGRARARSGAGQPTPCCPSAFAGVRGGRRSEPGPSPADFAVALPPGRAGDERRGGAPARACARRRTRSSASPTRGCRPARGSTSRRWPRAASRRPPPRTAPGTTPGTASGRERAAAPEPRREPFWRDDTFGPYQLLDRVAVGGMAEVFKAKRIGRRGLREGGGGEAHPAPPLGQPGVRRHVRGRGQDGGRPHPPEHRPDLRPRADRAAATTSRWSTCTAATCARS